ncbi:MAG: Gx transporter family protein [Bacillus sp. (in: Bacteria)]|nr:Gx transporter family protein [Bacillus sp. (in: firmicutes)]MCM1427016.1 Gx transporter family protein [Eubacterium sp.]
MEKKVVLPGFLLALSMILSYIESVLPFAIGIPGVKLGLPNLVVVLLLYTYGAKEAFIVNVLRILLSGFLFGNLYSILYALAGAVCSFVLMLLLRKAGYFSVAGVSIGGGVFHNIGQILVAIIVVETYAPAFYLPFLLIAGAVTGFVIGIIAMRLLPYMQKWKEQ